MIGRWLLFVFVMIGLPVGAALQSGGSKPVLWIVQSPGCQPCHVFDKVYAANPEFRAALQDAFELRKLDCALPLDAISARSLGVDRLPSFVLIRHNRIIAKHVGFACSLNAQEVADEITAMMTCLKVEWPRQSRQPAASRPTPEPSAPVSSAAAESVDLQARDGLTKLASQTRNLQAAQEETQDTVDELQGSVQQLQTDVAGVKAEVTQSGQQLSQQLQQSHESTRSEVSKITDRLQETIRNTIGSTQPPDISTEIQSTPPALTEPPAAPTQATPESGVASWLIKAGLTGAAVYFGLPVAGAGIGAAAVTWLLRRRSARKADRSFRPGHGAATTAGSVAPTPCNTPLPRQLDEAGELLRLREREGRHPLHDALFGMLADTELDSVTRDPDPVISGAAVRLRDRITQRFNSIAPLSTSQKDYVS